MDRLRGLYVKSPAGLRRLASPLLSLVPPDRLFGPGYAECRRQILHSGHDAEFVRRYQSEAVRTILQACRTRSPHYRSALPALDPGEVDPADLSALPILHKGTVRENPDSLLVVDRASMDTVSTSGSSGRPLMFYLDKDRSVREWAFITHVWARVGYSPGKRRAVLRGVFLPNVDIRPWGYDAALRELRLSPFHLLPKGMDQYLRLISRYRVSFIHGYPSAIAILAGHALNASWSPPSSLEGILPISERLTVDQRELFRAAFGDVAVLSYYGLSEKAAFAGEIPGEPDVYEFEPLYGITELVDDEGRPIREPGEQGRIIGTGLLSRGMPLLRYDTEDRAELVRAPTHDNAYRLRVRGITSRWSEEYLVSKQGSLVSIAAINVHSRAYADVREFQFFQDTQGVVVLRVVPREGVCAEALARLANDFRTKVGSGLRIELEVVKAIDTNTRGKRLFVDQRLAISRPVANPSTLS